MNNPNNFSIQTELQQWQLESYRRNGEVVLTNGSRSVELKCDWRSDDPLANKIGGTFEYLFLDVDAWDQLSEEQAEEWLDENGDLKPEFKSAYEDFEAECEKYNREAAMEFFYCNEMDFTLWELCHLELLSPACLFTTNLLLDRRTNETVNLNVAELSGGFYVTADGYLEVAEYGEQPAGTFGNTVVSQVLRAADENGDDYLEAFAVEFHRPNGDRSFSVYITDGEVLEHHATYREVQQALMAVVQLEGEHHE